MGFRRGLPKILLRTFLMTVWTVGLAYSYFNTDLTITPFMFGLLILISAVEMAWFLQRQERNWIKFLESIKYQDFNRVYQKQASSDLSEAYELITRSMEELQSNNQAEYRLLQTVLGHVSIGVACYQESGKVVFTNKSFDALLDIPGLINIDRLKVSYPLIYEVIERPEINPAGWIDHKNGQKLFVKTESFKLKGVHHKLVSLTDIRSSLEAKELESYQKLMRVMTHEIMNSTNPVLSLIKVINKKLIQGDALVELEKKDQRNIVTSLNAIEERTAGILKFVSAYKEINRPIQPHLEQISSKEFLNSVKSLMDQSSPIDLDIYDQLQSSFLVDLSLMTQVVINLVKNAKEALGKIVDPKISITITSDHTHTVIQVSDNGPGVQEVDVHQIFVPFYTTKTEGSGIGLALSRKIVRAHGGTLEYKREGELSNFIVRLPADNY